MLGRNLTPPKIAARVPRVFWASVLTEWLLGQKAAIPQRLRSIVLLRTAVRVFGPAERALLKTADALADTPANVSDELFAEPRRHFPEEQLIEFAAAAAQENFRALYNRVFDVGSDGLYRKGLHFKQR